jgi:hypothetical protein
MSFDRYCCTCRAGPKDKEEEEALRKVQLPDEYVTAVPFYAASETPVKEQNSGTMWASSPVFGLHRVPVKGDGEGGDWDLCIGDSVGYWKASDDQGQDESLCFGRITGLCVGEEHGGLVAHVRLYMSSTEVFRHAPQFQVNLPDGAPMDGLWETHWIVTVPVDRIRGVVSVVKERSAGTMTDGGKLLLVGTVTDMGTWKTPYRRPLMASEEPWMAVDGVRSGAVERLGRVSSEGRPIINASVTIWTDKFLTFRTKITVSAYTNRIKYHN